MRSVALVVVCSLVIAGCGKEEDVSPSFEDRIPAGLELAAAERVVKWGQGTSLSGRLTQGDDALSGEAVVLEADAYPFRGDFSELESDETGEEGEFEFEAEPDANTAYRVVTGELSETTSAERIVYVEPREELETEAAGTGTRFTTVFRHAEQRSIQGSSFFSYAATVADAEERGKLNFLRVDRVEQVKPGLSEASIVLPFAEDEVRYSSCVSYSGDSGLGEPKTTCSQSEIQAGQP